VWFVTGNTVTESIVFAGIDPTQSRAFPLPAHYSFGSSMGIAVASDGSVWAGIDLALLHLNPTTGLITTYRVPITSNGFRVITAIAVSGTDTVALAIDDDDDVVLFRAGRFVTWSLPVNTQPEDVAYLNDGTLGVSLSDLNTHTYDRVVTYTPTGVRRESAPVDVYHLASNGTEFVSVDDQIVTFNARAQLTATLPFVPTLKPKVLIISPLAVLPNGKLLLRSGDGVLVASLTTGATYVVQLPRVACPTAISSSAGGTSSPAGSLCEEYPDVVTSDGAGDLWMLLANETQIDVVPGFGAS
jgi:sugar lactone lactonase YvrE